MWIITRNILWPIMSLMRLFIWDWGKKGLEIYPGAIVYSVILECSPSAPLVGGGSHREPGKEFQGFFRISTEKGWAYIVPDMPKKRSGYIKERKKKKSVLWKPAMVAEKGKGVDVISEILHQVIHIYRIELYEIVNLIHPSNIWMFGRERREVQGEKCGVCLDSGIRRVS